MLSVHTGLIGFFPLWVIYNNFSTVNCHEVFRDYYSINPLWVSMPVDKGPVNCTPEGLCVHVVWGVQKRLSYWWRRPIIQTPIWWHSTVWYVAFFLLKVVACKSFHVTLYINAVVGYSTSFCPPHTILNGEIVCRQHGHFANHKGCDAFSTFTIHCRQNKCPQWSPPRFRPNKLQSK